MSNKSVWKSNLVKIKNRDYTGSYKIYGRERAFVLNYKTKRVKHRLTFESHEAAKKLGWKKVA